MADIIIRGMIGDQDSDCDAVTVLEQLRNSRSQPVRLFIDSPGGDFYDGITIYNAIKQRTSPTIAVIGTLCGSAATIIACACSKVSMPASATYFVHQTSKLTIGHVREHQDAVAWLSHCDNLLLGVYAERTGKPVREIQKLIEGNGDGTPLSAEEAYRWGFVDEVFQSAARKSDSASRKTDAEMRNEIVNKLAAAQVHRIRTALQRHQNALAAKQVHEIRMALMKHQTANLRARLESLTSGKKKPNRKPVKATTAKR